MDRTKPVKTDDEFQKQFAALGLKVDIAPAEEDDELPVYEENWLSVVTFQDCETQWRVTATMSQLIWAGLDYASTKVLLEFEERATPEIFRDLRIMEAAALPVLNRGD